MFALPTKSVQCRIKDDSLQIGSSDSELVSSQCSRFDSKLERGEYTTKLEVVFFSQYQRERYNLTLQVMVSITPIHSEKENSHLNTAIVQFSDSFSHGSSPIKRRPYIQDCITNPETAIIGLIFLGNFKYPISTSDYEYPSMLFKPI